MTLPSASSSPTLAAPASIPSAKLVVLVPCLDEERTVAEVVRGVLEATRHLERVTVVVVDDGSTDETARRAAEAGAEVLRHPQNLGLGRAFRAGVQEALRQGAEVVVNIDGDGQFDPARIPDLVAPVLAGEADMVTASRFLDPALTPQMPAIKRWGNRWVARIVNVLTGRRFADVSCGFRAFSREALLRMNLFGGFTYTQETFLDLVFKGMAIREVAVAVRGTRRYGESRVASSLTRYALRSLQIMVRAFIGYRPFSFFSVLATFFTAFGLALLGFLLVHFLRTGAFSPHIWAGFTGGGFVLLGILTGVLGVVGDMLVRMRMNQEEILYFLKRRAYDRGR